MKIVKTKDSTHEMTVTEKVTSQEEPLPEIKEGTMEIADGDDPNYKVTKNGIQTFLINYENSISFLFIYHLIAFFRHCTFLWTKIVIFLVQINGNRDNQKSVYVN